MERRDAEIAALQKKHQTGISELLERISAEETDVRDYCEVHRAELFPDKKSRETALAVFGFELTPHRVETTSRRITWKDVVARLLKLAEAGEIVAGENPGGGAVFTMHLPAATVIK